MKRATLVTGAALAAAVSLVFAQPVLADHLTDTSGGLVHELERRSVGIVNGVLEDVPVPEDWHVRHICVINDGVDKSLCVYFPWPV